MLSKLQFYLKVSRPGLWFATLWLYLLPTSGHPELFKTISFWLGLIYVCFPLNFLVYSWNDFADIEIDAKNPRKDSFWFGARGTKEQLKNIWKPNLILQIVFIALIIAHTGISTLVLFVLFFAINGIYNWPVIGWRSRPPLELFCQVGYLFIVPLSISLNGLENLSIHAYIYLLLFAIQSHLMGEVMDIEPDKESGRRTTATVLGIIKTKILIILIVLSEIVLLLCYFKEYIFTMVLTFGLLWLLIDLLWVFKKKNYTLKQMKIFAICSNLIAIVTIIYVWLSGCLILN